MPHITHNEHKTSVRGLWNKSCMNWGRNRTESWNHRTYLPIGKHTTVVTSHAVFHHRSSRYSEQIFLLSQSRTETISMKLLEMEFHLIWRLGMSWTMRTLLRNCNCDPVEPVTCVMDSPATWSKVKRVSGCPNQVMVWGPSCRRHLVTPFPAASVPVRGRVRIKTCHH